jgi:uncharacterized integral membrane protein
VSDQPPPKGSKKRTEQPHLGRYVVAAIVAVYVILFALFNRDRVEVDWVLFERNSRLIYVIIISALLGALADRLIQRRRRE